MPQEGPNSAEETLSKLGKDVIWLRVGLVVALVVLALVVVAVLQMRAPVSELASERATPSSVTVRAARFVLLDIKGQPRGELSLKDGLPRLELFDAEGKVTWTTPLPLRPVEPVVKESPEAKKAEM